MAINKQTNRIKTMTLWRLKDDNRNLHGNDVIMNVYMCVCACMYACICVHVSMYVYRGLCV